MCMDQLAREMNTTPRALKAVTMIQWNAWILIWINVSTAM